MPNRNNECVSLALICVLSILGNIPANDPKIKRGPSGIIYATASLLKNKTYIFNTLALCCTIFYVAAMGPFLIRVMMIKYGADPKKIGLAFGIVLLLGSVGLLQIIWMLFFVCYSSFLLWRWLWRLL